MKEFENLLAAGEKISQAIHNMESEGFDIDDYPELDSAWLDLSLAIEDINTSRKAGAGTCLRLNKSKGHQNEIQD